MNTQLFNSIKEIIIQARQIVEDEQEGNARAGYGKNVLKNLAHQLTIEFGKGFDESNLRNMRQFFKTFPICDTLRHELSWSHYRLLCRLDSEKKIQYYLTESIAGNWNSRTLQRQINSLAFERVLSHKSEADLPDTPQNILKDPYACTRERGKQSPILGTPCRSLYLIWLNKRSKTPMFSTF